MTQDMRPKISVPLGSGEVVVRELNVGELRALMADMAAKPGQWPVDQMLVEGWDMRELAAFVEGGQETLDRVLPSELHPLTQAAEDLNKDFFGMRARARDLLARLQNAPAPNSNEPSRA